MGCAKRPAGPVGALAGVLLLVNATWIKSNMLVQKRSNARLGPIRGKRHGCGKKIIQPLGNRGSSVEKEPHVNRNYEWAHAAKWRPQLQADAIYGADACSSVLRL